MFHLNRLQTLHIENNRLVVIHNDVGYLDQLEDLVCLSIKLIIFMLVTRAMLC